MPLSCGRFYVYSSSGQDKARKNGVYALEGVEQGDMVKRRQGDMSPRQGLKYVFGWYLLSAIWKPLQGSSYHAKYLIGFIYKNGLSGDDILEQKEVRPIFFSKNEST